MSDAIRTTFNNEDLFYRGSYTKLETALLLPPTVANPNIVYVIGTAKGGVPFDDTKTIQENYMVFKDVATAQKVLYEGDLLDAVTQFFSPSSETESGVEVICLNIGNISKASFADTTRYAIQSKLGGFTANQVQYSLIDDATNVKWNINLVFQSISEQYIWDKTVLNIESIDGVTEYKYEIVVDDNTNNLKTLFVRTVGDVDVAQYSLSDVTTLNDLIKLINTSSVITASLVDSKYSNYPTGALILNNGVDYFLLTGQGTSQALGFDNTVFRFILANSALATYISNTDREYEAIALQNLTGGEYSDFVLTQEKDAYASAFTYMEDIDCDFLIPLTYNSEVLALAQDHARITNQVDKDYERVVLIGLNHETDINTRVTELASYDNEHLRVVFSAFKNLDALRVERVYKSYILAVMMASCFVGFEQVNTTLDDLAFSISDVTEKLSESQIITVTTHGGNPLELRKGRFVIPRVVTADKDIRIENKINVLDVANRTVKYIGKQLDVIVNDWLRSNRTGFNAIAQEDLKTRIINGYFTELESLGIIAPDPNVENSVSWEILSFEVIADALYIEYVVTVALPLTFVTHTVQTKVFGSL